MTIRRRRQERWLDFLDAAERAWMFARLFLRYRPLVRCPGCKGSGGEVCGYYEPEFQECYLCYHSWAELEDCGVSWAAGRIDPLKWPSAKLYSLTAQSSFWGWIRCRLGFHQYDDFGGCVRCWRSREEGRP